LAHQVPSTSLLLFSKKSASHFSGFSGLRQHIPPVSQCALHQICAGSRALRSFPATHKRHQKGTMKTLDHLLVQSNPLHPLKQIRRDLLIDIYPRRAPMRVGRWDNGARRQGVDGSCDWGCAAHGSCTVRGRGCLDSGRNCRRKWRV